MLTMFQVKCDKPLKQIDYQRVTSLLLISLLPYNSLVTLKIEYLL